jgi:hypothetical protein
MACDLAETPRTGLAVQACGDCHLANFGLFASPERTLVFDINDFDETLRARDGHDYSVRQLRDMKYSAPIADLEPCGLDRYADLCGWALARAHARSADAAAIGGYLGRGDQFDLAIGKFAVAYADQTEQDHAALVQAHRAGRIAADAEAD